MATLREHRLALGILLAVCALAAFGKLGLIGTEPSSDYTGYIETAKLLSGLPAEVHPERLLKPLAPLGTALLAPLTGFPTAFLFEVLLGYFAFALVLYALGYAFFEDRWKALTVALLSVLSYPLLRYGVDLYTETWALFFYCLSLLLTLRYLKVPSKKLIIANALVISIGFLWKEYSVVTGIIFALALITEPIPARARISNLVLLGVAALPFTLLVQAWVYLSYHYTYLDWYLEGGGGSPGFQLEFTLRNIVKSSVALLGVAWLLVPLGLRRFRELALPHRRFIALAILPPFMPPLWGHVGSRIFYPTAPVFVLLAVVGLYALPKPYRVPALLLALLFDIVALLLIAT